MFIKMLLAHAHDTDTLHNLANLYTKTIPYKVILKHAGEYQNMVIRAEVYCLNERFLM